MKTLKILFLNVILISGLMGCGKGSDSMSNEEKISGKESKTWEATRETDAQGDKDKLTKAEKKQTITFSRSGNVKMSDEQNVMSGTWSYMDNTLSLQFTGTNVTESFTVLDLQDDKMKLQAADGSQLSLEPK